MSLQNIHLDISINAYPNGIKLIELAFFVLSLSFSTLPRLSHLSKNAMVRDFPLSNTLPKHSYLPQFERASKSESIYFCQWNQAIAHLH
ncbi:hypothetical protein THOE12_90216 [Vibrio rotiferianus]|nr:hypothetical protein THOE12_90216 [Vibrio rotiferianus]